MYRESPPLVAADGAPRPAAPDVVSVTHIGALAAEAMAEAIVRAVSMAETASGVPAARDLGTVPARMK
jgi:L-aminopeptidase/D-esterase-like protein